MIEHNEFYKDEPDNMIESAKAQCGFDDEYVVKSDIEPEDLDKRPRTVRTWMAGEKINYEFIKHDNEKEIARQMQEKDAQRPPLQHPDLNNIVLDRVVKNWLDNSSEIEQKRAELIAIKQQQEDEIRRQKEWARLKSLPAKGVIVFKVAVGQLPTDKIEGIIEKFKTDCKKFLDRVPAEYEVMFLPVREESSDVQVIRL